MDDFNEKIKQILDTPDNEVDINYAATILLQLNRNRILFQNIVRRNNIAKLKYELQKIYDFRIKDNALQETKALEVKVVEILTNTPSIAQPETDAATEEKTLGKRADHDQLPDEVKALFLENLNIFRRVRKLHEQLKLMIDKLPCDRYPYLKEMVELYDELRENWNRYDAFVLVQSPFSNPDNANPAETDNSGTSTEKTSDSDSIKTDESSVEVDAKKVSAARKYLSTNKSKLAELKTSDETAFIALLAKMQERYDYLVSVKEVVSDEQKAEFATLGLNV